MKKLQKQKELHRNFHFPSVQIENDFRKAVNALIHEVEDRCAETIKECKGIPYDRIDTAGRKWIHAPSDIVAAAIQTGRKK